MTFYRLFVVDKNISLNIFKNIFLNGLLSIAIFNCNVATPKTWQSIQIESNFELGLNAIQHKKASRFEYGIFYV